MFSPDCFNFATISFFYQDQAKFLHLESVYQKNVNFFINSTGISNHLPSFSELEQFLIPCLKFKKRFSFNHWFRGSKECLFCFISMYEIMSSKSFDHFVILYKINTKLKLYLKLIFLIVK